MKIDFEFTHPIHGVYKDALNLPDDHSMTEEELNAMKKQRFDSWVLVLETSSVDNANQE